LPESLFACSETFFDKSKACSRQWQNSPFGLKQLASLFFRFAKICEKKRFNEPLKGIPIWATARRLMARELGHPTEAFELVDDRVFPEEYKKIDHRNDRD
jgi:hypothetical protein